MTHAASLPHLPRRSLLQLGAIGAAAGLAPSALGATGSGSPAPAPAVHTGHRSKGTLLVLGGTGFLGPHVVEAALARGLTPVLFHRGRTNADLFPELEKLYGDRDPKVGEGLKALEGDRRFDFVVDTSSYVPRITQASCELLADRIGAYALVSTVSVYPDLSTVGMDESAPVGELADPTAENLDNQTYGPLKALCEKAAEAALPGRVFTVRPGLIVGPRDSTDRFTYWPARFAEGGDVLCPGTPDDPVQFLDVRDLAEFLVDGLLQGARGVFNAVGPRQGATMGELAYGSKAVGAVPARLHWVAEEELNTLGLRPWAELPVWAPPAGPLAGLNQVSAAKAHGIGLTSRPVADTCLATLTWWLSQSAERRARMRAGMSREAEAKALAARRGD